jgi:hypothetical protein
MHLSKTVRGGSVPNSQADACTPTPGGQPQRLVPGGRGRRRRTGARGLLDLPTVRAAAQKLRLTNVSEFTTSCNFCSCGCGMIAAVREGKLIAMEGDYDHIVCHSDG